LGEQTRARVLVADPIADDGVEDLRRNFDVDVITGQRPEELLARIGDYEALVVRSETRVTADQIQAARRMRIIGRAGVGVDNIDVEAATRAGVLVVNAPSGNTIAATEHTMAMMLALARHIPQADQAVKAGRWERSRFLGTELRDKVLGVVGLGSIGREVAHRAQAFGMHVIATDPVLSEERAAQLNVRLVPFDQLMSEADLITLHVPLTRETHHLVDARALALAKPGVRLINVARGGIVDESALREALRDGQVAGAAIDVFEQEPPGENPLLSLPQVITTPHLGASTEEAQISVALEITEQVIAVLDGGLPRFSLNAPVALPEAMAFLRPFLPVAEGIGRFYAQVGRQPAARLHVDYAGEIANYDCSVLTAALLTAFLSRFSAERVNPVNARTVAAAHGITVVEQRGARASEFANLISLQAVGEHGTTRVGGTLLLNEPHIVTFNDFRIDLVPHGTFLMSWHADRPGIVGAIGTFLGEKNINIASMQVGRDRPRGDAVMILSVDDPVPESILADIRRIPGMADVLSVSL
jgi:D-3-phosphoglycerate dehydrogenase / 2-oxoglutarate reductase